MNPVQVTALIVNFNAGPLLEQSVSAVLQGSLRPRILVADNASTDGSARRLQGRDGVEVLFNVDNPGFSRAVNAAARQTDSEFLLVLNPDCVVEADTLALLVEALAKNGDAGLAAPLVTDWSGRAERSSLRHFPDPWRALVTLSGLWRLPFLNGVSRTDQPLPTETTVAEAVSGACMLVRRSAFRCVGGLDENYALHCEDLDLMARLQEAGWSCLFVPAARARHAQGVSSRSRPLWVHRQKHRGMARFFRKFQAQGHAWPVRWLVHAGIWIHFLVTAPMALLRR